MPFKNVEQMRACFAKDDPKWNCEKWLRHTPGKLKHKKKADLELRDKLAKSMRFPIRKGTVKGPLAGQLAKGREVTVKLKKKSSMELLMGRLQNLTGPRDALAGVTVNELNRRELLDKAAALKPLLAKWAKKDMPHFTEQDRPKKVKEIYSALKREHPGMPASMKARIASRQGKPGKQKQGPPYKGPLSKESGMPLSKKKKFQEMAATGRKKSAAPLNLRAQIGQKILRALSRLGATPESALRKPSEMARKYVFGGARAATKPGAGMLPFTPAPEEVRGEIARRLGHLGTAGVGAGALGIGGLGYALKGSSSQQIGTPFMDGFLQCCLDSRLSGDQVADLLEKASADKGRLGKEAKGLMDRMLKTA